MSERSRDLRVGLFVLGGVLLLVAGLFALGFREALAPRIRVETALAGDVAGLSVGSPVELRGIRVGQVTEIDFTWNAYPATKTDLAIVRFDVKASILPRRTSVETNDLLKAEVDRGLRVRVRSQALTGTSILSVERVDPKENPVPKIDYAPRDFYLPSAASQLTRMLDAIEKTLAALQEIRVQPVLERVDGAVASIEALARKLGAIRTDRLEGKANAAVDEVVLAAKDLHGGVASARAQIDELRLGENGQRIARLLDELLATTTQLKGTLQRVDGIDVDGINEAITGLRRAAENLDQTLQEARDYPAGALLGQPPRRPPIVEEKKP